MTTGLFTPTTTTSTQQQQQGSGFSVWDGTSTSTPVPRGIDATPESQHATGAMSTSPNMVDGLDYLVDKLGNMSNQELKQLQAQLSATGYLPQSAVTGEYNSQTQQAYLSFLQDVSFESSRSGPITPDAYMSKILHQQGIDMNSDGSTSRTSTSSTIVSADDAQAQAMGTFRSLLGRKPTQHEMEAFASALQAYDASHPSVTTSTTGKDGNSSSTTTGGGNDSLFAQNYIDTHYGKQEGAHDALHYFDLVNQTLTGPPAGIQHAN